MPKLADDVFAQRASRNAVKVELEGRISRLKDSLEDRGIGGRVADEVSEGVRGAFDDAMEVAGESKGIIAGTVAVLAIWFLRNPIIARLEGMLASREETEGQDSDDE